MGKMGDTCKGVETSTKTGETEQDMTMVGNGNEIEWKGEEVE